jgi:hypothetical protein
VSISLDNNVVEILNRNKACPMYRFEEIDALEISLLAPDSRELLDMFSPVSSASPCIAGEHVERMVLM